MTTDVTDVAAAPEAPAEGRPAAVCLACGSAGVEFWARAKDVEYYSTPDEFTYWRCGDCGALSIGPPPVDRLSEIYPPTYYSFGDDKPSLMEAVKRVLDRRLFRSIFRTIKGDSLAALDVGGGTGWLLDQARMVEPRLERTVVVDIDAQAKPRAEARGHEFVVARIEEYESDQSFDLIMMLNLIEHVSDPVEVLKKMRALLAPGGVILIKTPNHDSLDARIFRHRSWGGYHCPRHWVLFTPESFERAAETAGLTVETIRQTQGAPFWAWSALNWMKERGLATVSYDKPAYRHPLMPLLTGFFAGIDFVRSPFMNTSQMFVVLRS